MQLKIKINPKNILKIPLKNNFLQGFQQNWQNSTLETPPLESMDNRIPNYKKVEVRHH